MAQVNYQEPNLIMGVLIVEEAKYNFAILKSVLLPEMLFLKAHSQTHCD